MPFTYSLGTCFTFNLMASGTVFLASKVLGSTTSMHSLSLSSLD